MNPKFLQAAEAYFAELGMVRASGGATGELSSYGPLANLFNAVGATLKPKVFCVQQLADQGAGHPDFGLYTAQQVQRGRPREGQKPERGVVEVKAVDDDAWLTASGHQVSRYWGQYRLVLVTNLRDFVLVGEDKSGQPVKLETLRLADGAEDFRRKLERPRAFARTVGSGLGEYLAPRRFASREDPGAEGSGLAARFLCARWTVPRRGGWRLPVAHIRAQRAGGGVGRPLRGGPRYALFPLHTGADSVLRRVLRLGCFGRGPSNPVWVRCSTAPTTARSVSGGAKRSGICACPCSGRCSSSCPIRVACSFWNWWRCWNGRPPPSTGWNGARSSRASTKARRSSISTNPSSKRSIPVCESSWGSGTRRSRSCATWSPAWTGR